MTDTWKEFDFLKEYVNKGIEEEYITKEIEACGPSGHLYVAVANLLDYCSSELSSDREVEIALKLAKEIATKLT